MYKSSIDDEHLKMKMVQIKCPPLVYFSPLLNRYQSVYKQVWWGTKWAEEECRQRWRQVSGALQGRSAQEETQAQPHHLHHLPAAWAGACLWEVPLPRRVQSRGAGYESEPPWSQSSGKNNHNITGANTSLHKQVARRTKTHKINPNQYHKSSDK